MACKLKHQSTLMNSREFLIGQKAIDKLNRIIDQDKFIQASQSLSDEASTVYGVNGSLWIERASRAVPVASVLKEIDDKRRDMGLYESQSAGILTVDVEVDENVIDTGSVGVRIPGITVLSNGNLKIVAFRTEKAGTTSKGQYQRGKGLYLSLDRPYPGEDVYTVEVEVSPKNLLDRKLGLGEISEDYFIDEKNKVRPFLDDLQEFKLTLGIKAEIGSIDGVSLNELVLFDPYLINQAIASKQLYSQYPDSSEYTLEDYQQSLDSNKRQNEDAGAEDLDLSTFDNYFPEFSHLEETDKEAVLEAIKEGELNVNCKI